MMTVLLIVVYFIFVCICQALSIHNPVNFDGLCSFQLNDRLRICYANVEEFDAKIWSIEKNLLVKAIENLPGSFRVTVVMKKWTPDIHILYPKILYNFTYQSSVSSYEEEIFTVSRGKTLYCWLVEYTNNAFTQALQKFFTTQFDSILYHHRKRRSANDEFSQIFPNSSTNSSPELTTMAQRTISKSTSLSISSRFVILVLVISCVLGSLVTGIILINCRSKRFRKTYDMENCPDEIGETLILHTFIIDEQNKEATEESMEKRSGAKIPVRIYRRAFSMEPSGSRGHVLNTINEEAEEKPQIRKKTVSFGGYTVHA